MRCFKHRKVGLCGVDGDFFSLFVFSLIFDDAVYKSEKRMVLTHPYVVARVDLRTALAIDDVTGDYRLSADLLYTQSSTR